MSRKKVALLLLSAPFIRLAFLVFLPALGFYLVGKHPLAYCWVTVDKRIQQVL
jgi:hypothetical protein